MTTSIKIKNVNQAKDWVVLVETVDAHGAPQKPVLLKPDEEKEFLIWDSRSLKIYEVLESAHRVSERIANSDVTKSGVVIGKRG